MDWAPQWSARRAGAARRRSAELEAEALEGRQLLARFVINPAAMPPAQVGQIVPRPQFTTPAGSGVVRSAPHFYQYYVGPHLADLEPIAASARFTPDRLTLTGTMLGPIISPLSTSQQVFYVWGLDRGSPSVVAPFPGKPNIQYDQAVIVGFSPLGVSAAVQDLTTNTVTPLTAGNITVRGRQIRVDLNPSLVPTPTSGFPLNQSNFALWTRDSLTDNPIPTQSNVASFIPPDTMAPIAAPQPVFVTRTELGYNGHQNFQVAINPFEGAGLPIYSGIPIPSGQLVRATRGPLQSVLLSEGGGGAGTVIIGGGGTGITIRPGGGSTGTGTGTGGGGTGGGGTPGGGLG